MTCTKILSLFSAGGWGWERKGRDTSLRIQTSSHKMSNE